MDSQQTASELGIDISSFLADQTTNPVFLVRQDGSLEYYNKSLQDLLGYTAEELKLLHIYDFDLESIREKWVQNWEAHLQGGTHEFRGNYLTKSGATIPVACSVIRSGLAETMRFCVVAKPPSTLQSAPETGNCLSTASLDTLEQAGMGIVLFTENERIVSFNEEAASGIEGGSSSDPLGNRTSDALFEAIADAAPDMIFAKDLQGCYIYFNSAAARMTGKSPSEVIGKDDTFLFPPNEAAIIMERDRQITASGKNTQIKEYITSQRGESRIMLSTRGPLFDSTGRVSGLYGISRDITEPERTRERILSQHSILQGILESSGSPIFSLDTNYRYTCFNRSHAAGMKALYGAEIEIGMGLLDYMTVGKDRLVARANFDRALAGESFIAESFAGDSDLSRPYFEITHCPIRNGIGSVIGVAVLSRDITSRRQAEEDLRQSERFARGVLNGLSANIAIVDESGAIVEVNESWRQFAAQNQVPPTKDFVGDNYFEVCRAAAGPSSEEAIPFLEGMSRVLAGDVAEFEMLYPCHSPDVERWFLGRVTRFHGRGKPMVVVAHENVTGRILAEKELEESDRRFRMAILTANAMVYDYDLLEKKTNALFGLSELTGYSADELVASPEWWEQQVHPDDVAFCKATIESHLANQEDMRFEYRVRHKNGHYLFVEDSSRMFSDENGNIDRVVGVVVDITPRKCAEQTLRSSEEKYRSLYETMRDAFVHVDMNGHLIEWNNAYENMLGYSPDELHNLTYIDLTPTKWHKYEASVVSDQILVRGFSDIYEKEYRRKDGIIIPVELRAVLLRDRSGQPSGMWAIIRDITERRRIMTELEQRERDIRIIADSVPVGVCRRNKDGICTYANSQFARHHGMTVEQAAGLHLREFLNEARLSKLKPYINDVLKGNPVTFDEEYSDESGNRLSRHVNLLPDRGSDGSVQGYFLLEVDTTEMHERQSALQQANQQLEVHRTALESKNIALQEILDSLQREREKYRHQICESILSHLSPIAKEIRKREKLLSSRTQARLDDLEKKLGEDMLRDYADLRTRLSPREVDICELIRKGMSSKDISEQLHISIETVTKHRYSIRKKLQIGNTNLSLASYLRKDL